MSFISDLVTGGSDDLPVIAPPVTPPTRADAAQSPVVSTARRSATARGRASTILTGELGSLEGLPNGRRRLGVA